MALFWRCLVAAAIAAPVACGSSSEVPPKADEDERGSVGVPPPAARYCMKSGFTLVNGECTFPDGTSCAMTAFYNGQCGQAHSYCTQHGGTPSSQTEDMGSWTATYAACDLNGKRCHDSSFAVTGTCN